MLLKTIDSLGCKLRKLVKNLLLPFKLIVAQKASLEAFLRGKNVCSVGVFSVVSCLGVLANIAQAVMTWQLISLVILRFRVSSRAILMCS